MYHPAQNKSEVMSPVHLEHKFGDTMDVISTLQLLVRREIFELNHGAYRFQVELVRDWFERES